MTLYINIDIDEIANKLHIDIYRYIYIYIIYCNQIIYLKKLNYY